MLTGSCENPPEVLYELVFLHVFSPRHVTEFLNIRLEEILLIGSEAFQEVLCLGRVVVEDQFQVHVYEDWEEKLTKFVLWRQGVG